MKNLLSLILICVPLAACFQDDVQPVEAKIDYPPLAAQADFDALQLEPIAEIADIDAAKTVLSNVLSRLMNVTEIANQMADEVAEGSSPNPLFKTRARVFKILEARSDLCSNTDGESTQTEALVQNDVDNDGKSSLGDEWFYIWESCENASNNSEVTGVMSFTGMLDPIGDSGSSLEITSFSNYQYTFDLQIDSLNNKSAFYQNAKILFSRELDGDNEITTLKILPDSLMGVISGSDLYVFDINSATMVSNEDDETLVLDIDARYFVSNADVAGYVDVVTTESLLFEYQYNSNLINPLSVPRLLSGSLDVTGQNDEVANLVADTDVEKLKVTLGGSGGESELVDQALFFDTGSFALVNLTGASN